MKNISIKGGNNEFNSMVIVKKGTYIDRIPEGKLEIGNLPNI